MAELRGSVSQLTLNVVNMNTTTTMTLNVPVDLTQFVVSDLQPDTVYSATLTVTVHGGDNITSAAAITRTTSGGQQSLS